MRTIGVEKLGNAWKVVRILGLKGPLEDKKEFLGTKASYIIIYLLR